MQVANSRLLISSSEHPTYCIISTVQNKSRAIMLAAVLQRNMISRGNNTKHVKILKLVKGTYHFLKHKGRAPFLKTNCWLVNATLKSAFNSYSLSAHRRTSWHWPEALQTPPHELHTNQTPWTTQLWHFPSSAAFPPFSCSSQPP